MYRNNNYYGRKEQAPKPEFKESPYQTCHIVIPPLDLPQERVKLSSITMEDIAPDNKPIFLNRCYSPYPTEDRMDEALLDLPDPEDLTVYFTAQELEQAVPSGALRMMSKGLDSERDVKWMARRLNLDGPTMTVITDRYGDDLKEWAYQCMEAWKRMYGGQGTVRELVNVLKHTNTQVHVWILKDYLVRERKGELPEESDDEKDDDKNDKEKEAAVSAQQRGWWGWGGRI